LYGNGEASESNVISWGAFIAVGAGHQAEKFRVGNACASSRIAGRRVSCGLDMAAGTALTNCGRRPGGKPGLLPSL